MNRIITFVVITMASLIPNLGFSYTLDSFYYGETKDEVCRTVSSQYQVDCSANPIIVPTGLSLQIFAFCADNKLAQITENTGINNNVEHMIKLVNQNINKYGQPTKIKTDIRMLSQVGETMSLVYIWKTGQNSFFTLDFVKSNLPNSFILSRRHFTNDCIVLHELN
jgi:hypothetical protein